MPTLAVTGANGFVGRYVVRQALDSGWKVAALSRNTEWLRQLGQPALDVHEWDISQASSSLALFDGVDVVCHIAAYIPSDFSDPHCAHDCFEMNATGTALLLNAVRQAGVKKFIYHSAGGGGDTYAPSESPAVEDDPVYPSRRAPFYITSKIAGEVIASYFGNAYDMAVTSLRLSSLYGAGMRSGSLVARFISQALKGEPLYVNDGGTFVTDLLYVEDVAKVTLTVAEQEMRGIYNIGSGEQVTSLEVARMVVECVGAPPSLIQILPESGKGPPRQRAVDISKARRILNFVPTPPTRGIRKMVEILGNR